MRRVQEDFKLKDDKIAELDIDLGATIGMMSLNNGKTCWTMLPTQFVKAVVTTVEEDLAKHGKRLPSKCVTPFSCNYAPWLEETPGLKAVGVQRFEDLIGQLWWADEMGHVNILLETSLLSSYLAMPQAGHMEQAFHIFAYLKMHPKRKVGFDPSHPGINKWRPRPTNSLKFPFAYPSGRPLSAFSFPKLGLQRQVYPLPRAREKAMDGV
jgi:hypothetical protein